MPCPIDHSSMKELKTTEPLPIRMRGLPVDDRGYVVPWFVAWIDGKPEFRSADAGKLNLAIRDRLCWVCGQQLGTYLAFVAGPMCGINRTSAEPPSHRECAEWSARNCPFLNNPGQVRREDEAINNASLRDNSPGLALSRNPGVAMVWITRQYEVFPDGRGGRLIQMGEPIQVIWYACGGLATLEQVQASIDSGLPNLEAMAKLESGGMEHLSRVIKRFEKCLPGGDLVIGN